MLNLACRNTGKLIREKSKADNVRLGRLFTKKDTARLAAGKLCLSADRNAYTVLDPGAGTGILAAALVERICREVEKCKQIFLTCYEKDPRFLPMLEDNLERIRKKARHDYGVKLYVTVYAQDYLTESADHYTVTFEGRVEDRFDLILCHPPMDLYEKSSPQALAAGGVTQTKLSGAYLFLKTALRHMEPGGQLVICLPTAFASAAAMKPLRREVLSQTVLSGAHLFIGKQKNKSRAVPLRKELYLAFTKTEEQPESVTITVSTDAGTKEGTLALPALPYSFVVDAAEGAITLPKSREDTAIVRYLSSFPETFASLGLKMYTGRVLDARCEGMLFSEPFTGTVPLIRPACIRDGRLQFPQHHVAKQYISGIAKDPRHPNTLIQPNKNMIFVKRVPAKSDRRFVNAAVYLSSTQPAYRLISTHNKVNYIDTKERGAELCARYVYGIFALLNSTIYDRYVSIVSKSGQINAKEFAALPMPARNLIEDMGQRLMAERTVDVETCDKIVNHTLHIRMNT